MNCQLKPLVALLLSAGVLTLALGTSEVFAANACSPAGAKPAAA